MSLEIYLNSGELVTVSIDEKTTLTRKLMNDDLLTAYFTTTTNIPIGLGSYVVVKGVRYYVYQLPSIKKLSSKSFKYEVLFQGKLHRLKQKALISVDHLLEFPYTGTAQDHLLMLVASVNTIQAGWSVGTIETTDKLKINYSNDSCYSALYRIANAFNFDFQLIDQQINLKSTIGTIKPYTFEYGKGKGIYNIERKIIANAQHYTRLYAYGGTQNIKYDYRDRSQRLIFEERYLEKNTDIYGVKEGVFIDENIYPQRTSTLTAVNVAFNAQAFDENNSYITDANLDFDINTYLIEGVIAKIVFKSGELSGYEFEIWKYDSDTKRIYIKTLTESDGFALPSETFKPKIGDEYTLVNIAMPQTYIIAAEEELQAAAQRYLDKWCVPKAMYVASLDQKKIREDLIELNEGDIVTVKDSDLGVDRRIRIVQVSYPFVNPSKITIQIADEIPYLRKQLDTLQIKKTSEAVSTVTSTIVNNVTNETTNNTTIINDPQTVEINGRKFKYIKDFDNTDSEALEVNDSITGNLWDRFTYVKKWYYLGGEVSLRESWDEMETIEKEQV